MTSSGGDTEGTPMRVVVVGGGSWGTAFSRLLSEHGLASSTSDARRLIAQGGLRIDGEAVTDLDVPRDRLNGAVLQAGKRRFVRLTGNG